MEISRTLSLAPTAPSEARLSLLALEGTMAPDQLDDVRLVVSELVTNSVMHSGLNSGEPITLTVEVSLDRVRVQVINRGRGSVEVSGRPGDQHGWGLGIVDQLADRWGTEHGSDTKVWAEFSLR